MVVPHSVSHVTSLSRVILIRCVIMIRYPQSPHCISSRCILVQGSLHNHKKYSLYPSLTHRHRRSSTLLQFITLVTIVITTVCPHQPLSHKAPSHTTNTPKMNKETKKHKNNNNDDHINRIIRIGCGVCSRTLLAPVSPVLEVVPHDTNHRQNDVRNQKQRIHPAYHDTAVSDIKVGKTGEEAIQTPVEEIEELVGCPALSLVITRTRKNNGVFRFFKVSRWTFWNVLRLTRILLLISSSVNRSDCLLRDMALANRTVVSSLFQPLRLMYITPVRLRDTSNYT